MTLPVELPKMKAVSLTAPWGTLCVTRWKINETRSWKTNYRGRLAIHQSKSLPSWARALAESDRYFRTALHSLGLSLATLPLGAVIGAVEVVDCVEITPFNAPTGMELAFGDYTPGRYMLRLANPVQLATPIPWKGALGLWDFEHPVVDYLLGMGNEPAAPPMPPAPIQPQLL